MKLILCKRKRHLCNKKGHLCKDIKGKSNRT